MSRRMRRELKRGQGQQRKPFKPAPPAKAGAPAKKKRTSPVQFFREVRAELTRVAWPTRSELLSSTGVVIVTVLLITGIVWLFDFILSNIVALLTK